MCGITGYITNSNHSKETIKTMVSVLDHRGPDNKGTFSDLTNSGSKISLGHSRLAIIDISSDGHQPMHYLHFSIVFNGEIYNYKEIKHELIKLGHQFKSDSDTEVILQAFEEWGLKCVERFIGMFSFVIYDKVLNKLFCSVDRAGVKPFYYYKKDSTFVFGSELKALFEFPEFEKEIDPFGVNLYFRYGYVPSPNSIFVNTNKLEGGKNLIYDIEKSTLSIQTYWDVNKVYSEPILNISYQDAKSELLSLFKSAFKYRMVSDVPVGVFLSGGYDSTLVTSILQKESKEKIKTFTIGFDHGNNEAPFAKEIANYLGTKHHELYCTEKEALEIVKDLPNYFDEPFADSSAIPTILVSRIARKEVTVALSADGGDEIFVGYNRYKSLSKHLSKLKRTPDFSRNTLSKLINLSSKFVSKNNYFLRHQLISLAHVLSQKSKFDSVNLINSMESSYESFYKNILLDYRDTDMIELKGFMDINKDENRALAFDFHMYLQNDILTKVDRASMSTSLESREPLLDHRIVEFTATLPFEYKYDGKTTKRILKDIVYDYVPKEIIDRPKTGFSVPVKHWLKNELKELVDDTLDFETIKSQGILNTEYLKKIYNNFEKNQFEKAELIWRVFQFQLWYNRWIKQSPD